MTQSKFAPLTEESKRLRSQLGYVSSRYAPGSEEVSTARRKFHIQRLIDLASAHGPFTPPEYQRIVAALETTAEVRG